MPMLQRRTAAPLLRIVKNQPHATNDDHVEQLPTPPSTTNNSARSSLIMPSFGMEEEEDVMRSPVTSEDENAARGQEVGKKSSFRVPRNVLQEEVNGVKRRDFRIPGLMVDGVQSSVGIKRARDEVEDWSSSDSNGIFGSERRKKLRAPAGFANIHAPQRTKKRAMQYGSKSQARAAAAADRAAKFRHRNDKEEKVVEPPRPRFQSSRVEDDDDVFEFGRCDDVPTSSGGLRSALSVEEANGDSGTHQEGSVSPSLSSLSSPPSSPSIERMRSVADASTEASAKCPICSEAMPADHITSFQQTFMKGSPILNYRWQQRFCHWHKQQDAKKLSTERGYPEIDWSRLPFRMQRCEKHLQRVIRDEVVSTHRDRLAEVLESGKAKTALGVLAGDDEKATDRESCGYYGPKGERMMTEHIVSHLSADIRQQSTRDRLVAASGVSGGVSGFVQAVLVPELAVHLVCEDMNVGSARAREIMLESAEVGELLHPDLNDLVGEAREED